MGLATYHDCDRREKRAVLQFFWRDAPDAPPRVRRAALEYAPFAVAATAVITVETGLLAWALSGRSAVLALAAGALALGAAWSSGRAARRWRALRATPVVGSGSPT